MDYDVQAILDPMTNPVTFAAPFFILTIVIELAALKWLDHDDNVTGYAFKDARASLSMGVGSLFFLTIFKLVTFFGFTALYVYVAPHVTPWGQLHPNTTWEWIGYWLLVTLGLDFGYYWHHRFSHRVRIAWAGHQAHHSSEYMNFGTALRQKWNPWFEFFFWLPLPILGFSPASMYAAFGINLIFQFFVHTELVDKLWRPIEAVFNTPAHHRVHHGSDPEYLDKNYAGIFIIWDKLFGTFQAEKQRPTYGLTYPVNTYNLLKLQYGMYGDIIRDVRATNGLRNKLGYVFGPPGWEPPGEHHENLVMPRR